MNETKFDFTYFFETIIQQILSLAMNLPATYTTLFTLIILSIIDVENMLILYAALVVGVVLKLIFTMSSKTKKLQTELFTIAVDLVAGLLIVFLPGFIVEWVVIILSVLYIMYYSYVMTISYTRLGHTTEDILNDLRHRHEKENHSSTKKR